MNFNSYTDSRSL